MTGIIGHRGLLLKPVGGGGGDPYIAFRKTIANLNVDLSDPFRTWTPVGGAAVVGGLLTLDGSTQYLHTPQDTDLDLTNQEFCFEGFVTLNALTGGEHVIFAKHSGAALSYLFGINAVGQATFYFNWSGVGDFYPFLGGPALPTATEMHMAWYRAGNNGYVAINGVPTNVVSMTGATVGTLTSANTIGAVAGGGAYQAMGIRGARITVGSSGGYGASNFTPPSFPLPTS